jgi:hypothetical protein
MARSWLLPRRPEREDLVANPGIGASRAIYGTLLAASVIVAWDDDVVEGLALAIVVTGVVFALVHVYADWLAAHAASPEAHVQHIMRAQWPLAEACLAPAALVLLGSLLVSDAAAVWWALIYCGVQQAGWSLALARRLGRASLVQASTIIAVNLALGVVFVGLKVLVH